MPQHRPTVRQLLDALGFQERDHDDNVRNALLELQQRRGHFDTYLASEQPTNCPKCNARTDFTTRADGVEAHSCPLCGYKFEVEHE